MSRVISYKTSDVSTFSFGRLHLVTQQHETPLVSFLRQTLADTGLNYREIANRSGGLITHSTVHDILVGRSKNPTTQTLKGLAKGLGIPDEIIFEAARGGTSLATASIESELLSYVRELSDVRKRDLLRMAKMFFNEQSDEGYLIFTGPNQGQFFKETTATFNGEIGGGLPQRTVNTDEDGSSTRDNSNVSQPRKRGGRS
jgi:transcriptional regulator with XRE-family HTH domain